MTPEQLMMPRYEVIAEDTSNSFQIGTVFQFANIHPYSGYSCEFNGRIVAPEYFARFPHLFRKLPWYSHRAIADLPEYVLWGEDPDREVSKVTEWSDLHSGVYALINNNLRHPGIGSLLPSTLEEYTQYINTKK